MMKQAAEDPNVVAFVWDTPLLFETGLNKLCDRVVYVEAPLEVRVQRVRDRRGWSPQELQERENLQMPLDSKRRIADDLIVNADDAVAAPAVREQVREVLSRILAGNFAPNKQPIGPALS